MEEIAEVYARALFEVAKERDILDEIHDDLGAFATALEENRELAVFFFSPYFSSEEKKNGLKRAVTGADPIFMNFLETLLERHRMPVIFRMRTRFEQLWDEEKKLLPVEITSSVQLDKEIVQSIGERIGEQTGQKVELSSKVDPEILGGLVVRVGNFVLDASIRNRLNQLRKQVARA
ncbi:MAG TPA: ATP synthase F1 subunit delta [Solirubrobacteraceae bacterium]|jgi:ATP synthase F1 delta subunit|nr:ATP synthase F1 subunit delta [Solirubrobacteraceae bacterium]